MSVSTDNYDVEAEFEAELARVNLEDPLDFDDLGSADSSDPDDDVESGEPLSLQVLRTALERRERAAEEFGREWERFCAAAVVVEVSTAVPRVTADTARAEVLAGADKPADATAVNDTNTDLEGSTTGDHSGPNRVSVGASRPSTDSPECSSPPGTGPTPSAASQPNLGGVREGTGCSAEQGSVSASVAGGTLGATHDGERSVGEQPTRPSVADEWETAGDDLDSRWSLVAHEAEGQRDCARAVPMRNGAVEALLATRERELEEQRLKALAELDAELARSAAERQAQIAAAAEEQARLAAEAEATSRRLELARREAAEREAMREAALAALRQEQLEIARKRVAALRISHAWRRYAVGPARAARRAAVVCIQAAWRGHVDRRRAAELRIQRSVLQDVEEAARAGQAGRLDTAIRRANEAGLTDVVQARLTALESAAGDAATKLRIAAANGSYLDFRAAMSAAQDFPSLAQLAAESSSVFERRRADAEAAIMAAVAEEPISVCYRLMESAAALGIEPQRLATARETVRQRDQQLTVQLVAASRAQGAVFDMAAFEALADRAVRLGLKGDASAARMVIERRRRALVASLRLRAAAASDAADCFSVAEEARRLGLTAEADELLQGLAGRQNEMQAALRAAVAGGNIDQVVALLQHASRLHLPVHVLQAFSTSLRDRQSSRVRDLAQAAAAHSLDIYLTARGAAVHSGVELGALLSADRVLAARREAAVSSLAEAADGVRVTLNAEPLQKNALAEALAPATRLGSARAVLERAFGTMVSYRREPGGSKAAAPQEQRGSSADRAQGSSTGRLGQAGLQPAPAGQRAPHYHVPLSVLQDRPMGILVSEPPAGTRGSGGHRAASDHGRGADIALGAQVAVWPWLKATVHLGLPNTACLTLCALDLQHLVRVAKGVHSLRVALVARDYWGMPLLPPWHAGGSGPDECASDASRIGHGALGGCGSKGTDGHADDDLLERVTSLLRRRQHVITLRPLAFSTRDMTLPSPTQLAASSNVPAAGLSAPADARPADAASHSSKRPGPPADEKGHPLTQAVILRNLPEATLSRHGTGASCLPRLFRLDLGLERLSSLQGLDVICPRLRTLSADANRLSSLDGVAGLSGLQELSLRQNQLGSLLRLGQGAAGRATGVLPSGRTLRWLALDANKLSGPLRGLSGCSGLRSLSLADNSLTDLGSELEACSPQLLSLSVRTNQLTSMHRQLLSLTNLRDLDVGGNRLATLDGIQGLLLLQSLRASGNAICSLPQPLCLPYLTSLELGQNRLTAFGDVGDGAAGGQLDCPRLRRLVLQENSIARLGALGPMVHLTSLDLSFNSLASLDAIHAVTHLSALRTLNLSNNPITDQPIPAGQASVGMRWAEGLAQVALGRVRGPGGGAAPNGGGAGSDSRISTRWALPCLQELNLDGVERPHRMAGVVRACTASPSSAVTGTRRMRGSSACFLVCHAASSACSSVAFGRQARAASPQARQTAGGLVSQRSLMRFAADIRGAAEPAAVQSLLVAAAGPPFGSAAASGLHAEMTATAGLGSKRLTPSAASVRSDAAGSCTAEGWLSRVGRAWHAASPLETLGLQSRMLAVAERGASLDDAALQGSPGGPAAGERLVDAVGSVLASSSLVAMAGLAHGGADLADFVTMRCFRPLARAARRLAAAGASPCGAAAPPEAHAHAAQLLRGTEAGRDSEAVWALITEAHGRFEALLAGAELEAAQEFKHQLIGRSTDSNPQLALSVKPQLFVAARPSYTLRCMCTAVGGAATKIQAAWRGFRTRKMLPQLRVEACDAEVLRRRAATTIQAWWRGHCVRRAKLLSALREAAQRSQAESRRREAAATRIQAHFRGHLVRKKLRKALAAVRFPAVPRGDSDLDSLGSDDLDAMLEGLAPIEKLLMDEVADVSRSAALPPEAAREPWRAAPQRDSGSGWQPGGLQGHLLPSSYGGAGSASTFGVPQAAFAGGARADLGAGSGLHAGLLGASAATDPPVPELHRPMLPGHGPLPVLQPQISLLPPQSAARPYVSQQVPHLQRGIGAPAMGMSPHSELATDQRPREVDQAAPPTHSAAAFASPAFHTARLPPISLRSSTPNSPHPAGLQGFSPQYMQEGAMLSPGFSEPSGEDMCNERGAAMMESASTEERERRRQRHMDRLKKLMAEWGFKDLSTAEAYYRRSQRQKQGNGRRKVQGRHYEVPQRHPVGQQKAGASQHSPTAAPPKSTAWPHSGSDDGFCSHTGPTEMPPAAALRNLNSADGVLVSQNSGGAASDVLWTNRSAGQGGRRESQSPGSMSAPGSGRLTLAPLAITSAIKPPQKAPVAQQRPHHLPALANNNWVASSSLQPQNQSASGGGKGVLRVDQNLTVTGSSGAIISRRPERPGTVQSIDSTPEVVMI